jgi:hypothetical protein
MRAIVVFESMFGHTQQIAESIGEGLRGRLDVEVVEVGSAGDLPEDLDLLVVGGPTHIWGMSWPSSRKDAREQAREMERETVSRGIGVRDWLRKLGTPPGNRAAAAFDTALRRTGWFPYGSAARRIASRLRRRGHRLIADPEQFFVEGIKGPLENGELERAANWGEGLAARLNPSRRNSGL